MCLTEAIAGANLAKWKLEQRIKWCILKHYFSIREGKKSLTLFQHQIIYSSSQTFIFWGEKKNSRVCVCVIVKKRQILKNGIYFCRNSQTCLFLLLDRFCCFFFLSHVQKFFLFLLHQLHSFNFNIFFLTLAQFFFKHHNTPSSKPWLTIQQGDNQPIHDLSYKNSRWCFEATFCQIRPD